MKPAWQAGRLLLSLAFVQSCRAERQVLDLSPDPLPAAMLELEVDAADIFAKPVRLPRRHHMHDFETYRGLDVKAKKTAKCNETVEVKALSELRKCPSQCGFMVQLPEVCTFRCVTETICRSGTAAPGAIVPDREEQYCRHCSVSGCDKCDLDNPYKCEKDSCALGYTYDFLHGRCIVVGGPFFLGVKAVLCLLLVYVVVWYCDLFCCRSASNRSGLEAGLQFREATKLMKSSSEGMEQYPLCTNLQATSNAGIAGPGTILHFNFQLFVIIWSLMMAGAWYGTAILTEPSLLIMGLRKAATPDMLCAVIHWGHSLMVYTKWEKVGFLAFAYVFTFLGTILYAAVQRRRFRHMDDVTTMKDFVACVHGLPIRSGSDPSVEEDTKAFLEEQLDQQLVGVSIAWNITEHEEEVSKALEAETAMLEEVWTQSASPLIGESGGPGTLSGTRPGGMRRALMKIDNVLFCLHGVDVNGKEDEELNTEAVKGMLANFETSGQAFAVFRNEQSRDEAVEACRAAGGFPAPSGEGRVRLELEDVEPGTVLFSNLGLSDRQFGANVVWGWIIVGTAQVLWVTCFYLPYAYYVSGFAYVHGDEPDLYKKYVLSFLVIAGNLTMYQVCSYVAGMTGFRFKDHCEVYYTALYSATCLINVLVDLWITAVLAYKNMVGLKVPTVDDTLLSQLESYHDVFESFSMQRSLGIQSWQYSFPGTFFLPFIIEPVATLVVIRHLMVLLVRCHPDLTPRQVEVALTPFVPMDMGRYADIMLNVLLASVSLYFASGFFLQTFLSLALSHVYILIYDHYRVLRCVPSFSYASDIIERFSQLMLGIPCGLILGALVVKSNCMTGPGETGPMCVRDSHLVRRLVMAFTAHMLLYFLICHSLLSWYMGKIQHEKASDEYAAVAARTPSSWFNKNPVHCLRSKYVHEHCPPCVFHIEGKEHLLIANPAIACFFDKPRLGKEVD